MAAKILVKIVRQPASVCIVDMRRRNQQPARTRSILKELCRVTLNSQTLRRSEPARKNRRRAHQRMKYAIPTIVDNFASRNGDPLCNASSVVVVQFIKNRTVVGD